MSTLYLLAKANHFLFVQCSRSFFCFYLQLMIVINSCNSKLCFCREVCHQEPEQATNKRSKHTNYCCCHFSLRLLRLT